ncbi:MAG: hypothetical protein E7580_05725 [Ruminococcaceae bacterium]|nr:hypothetical protein [Oscillospiraceae bacterium]
MKKFPYKQVHLDFHTWGQIPGVGKNFSKENFQNALREAGLDSITVFAKCHMGYCYYPSKYGKMHPNLDFDLTKAMVEAAQEIGVRAPVYITAAINEENAAEHPEWHAKRKIDGDSRWSEFTLLCLNNDAWAQHIFRLTEEVCQKFKKLDGLFFDIVLVDKACYCDTCKAGMAKMGLDYTKEEDAQAYYTLKRKEFLNKCRSILKRYHPEATIFFNSGGAAWDRPEYHEYSTHFEMEDLPTSWGGYDRLPMRAKFFAKSGKPYLAMTGKFHLNWGEFGGYKHPDAIKYEISSMALYGAGCSVGDHMHPDGVMDLATYRNIGEAYRYLEQIAPYCYGGEPTARLGLYPYADKIDTQGLANLLLSSQIEFEIADRDFSEFDLIVVPDGAKVSEDTSKRLNDFVAGGGKLLFFASSLLKGSNFLVDAGAKYLGEPDFDCDFIRTVAKVSELPDAPLLCYYCGHRIEATDGKVLTNRITSYFRKSDKVFCDYRHIPYDKEKEMGVAAVQKGNIIYSCHPLGSIYGQYGSLYHRHYFLYLLNTLGYTPAFEVKGLGSAGRSTMIEQPEQNRYCLNMVYGIPTNHGKAEVIEDLFPIYNVEITLHVSKDIKRAYLPLTGETLTITKSADGQSVTVPKLQCHASVVFEY